MPSLTESHARYGWRVQELPRQRQPALPPLVEDDQEYAEIDREEESAGEDAVFARSSARRAAPQRPSAARCQQDQIFLLKKARLSHGALLSD